MVKGVVEDLGGFGDEEVRIKAKALEFAVQCQDCILMFLERSPTQPAQVESYLVHVDRFEELQSVSLFRSGFTTKDTLFTVLRQDN